MHNQEGDVSALQEDIVSDQRRLPSRTILEGRDRAAARSYYYAIGFTEEDLKKPIIGIANTWTEAMPCNFHLRRLAAKVKEGVRAAGGTPMEFNTIAISDQSGGHRRLYRAMWPRLYVRRHGGSCRL